MTSSTSSSLLAWRRRSASSSWSRAVPRALQTLMATLARATAEESTATTSSPLMACAGAGGAGRWPGGPGARRPRGGGGGGVVGEVAPAQVDRPRDPPGEADDVGQVQDQPHVPGQHALEPGPVGQLGHGGVAADGGHDALVLVGAPGPGLALEGPLDVLGGVLGLLDGGLGDLGQQPALAVAGPGQVAD